MIEIIFNSENNCKTTNEKIVANLEIEYLSIFDIQSYRMLGFVLSIELRFLKQGLQIILLLLEDLLSFEYFLLKKLNCFSMGLFEIIVCAIIILDV